MKHIGSLRYMALGRLCASHFQPLLLFKAWRSEGVPLISQPEGILFSLPTLAKHHYFGVEYGIKRKDKSAPLQERKMMDRYSICVKGGDGGDGCTSFRKSRHSRHGVADGGRGGKGGDVILECSATVWDFSHLQHHINAKKGGGGSSKKSVGSHGQDKIVPVPVGTVIHLVRGSIPSLLEGSISAPLEDSTINILKQDEESHWQADKKTNSALGVKESEESSLNSSVPDCEKQIEHSSSTDIPDGEDDEDSELDESEEDYVESEPSQVTQLSVAELLVPGQSLTVACGGEGGRGNAAMARGRGSQKTLPSREHEPGHRGSEALLVLELKTIADVGLVGAPNAGKSTLLGAISRAKPRVGHYAFTTLRPNLGKLEFEDFFSITVADIPGLIKGAHQNVGLGHDFLRHIERTKALAYVVDVAAGLGDRKGLPPWDQLEELKFELEMYQSGLSCRPSLMVATKIDEEGAEEVLQEMRRRLPSLQILPVCAVLDEGIHELRIALRELVDGP